MTTPESSTDTDESLNPCPLVHRTFGEPRFHTEGDIAAVAFASDGTLWSIDEAGLLRHWSHDGQLLKRTYLSDLETLWCISPNAKLLASGNDDLLLWDVTSGLLLQRIPQNSWLTALAFSPNGAILTTGHDDGHVQFWDATTQKKLGEVKGHPSAVSAIAISPTGKHIATAGEDRVVRVWDAITHKLIAELKSHTDRIPSLTWSPDGSLLISAGWDTSARVWRIGETDPLILLNSHAEQVVCVAYNPVGQQLATADSDNDIYLWSDAATGKVGHILRGHADEIRCLCFSPDGTRLASAGADRVVHVWEVGAGKLLAGPNPKGKHGTAAFTLNGKLALASTGGPNFRVWDVATGSEIAPSNDGPAYSVASGLNWLTVGGVDHFTRLYDLANIKAAPRMLEATKPPIGALAIHPKGELIAHTSPADGLVWIWTPTGTEAQLILIEAADGCTLEDLTFHPDGKRLAVGGIDCLSTGERDGAVCIWDLDTKEKQITFDNGVYALAFDPSGRYLAGAGINDTVYIWDLTLGESIFVLEGHQERINAVAFSPDGSYLLSGGDDMTIRIWDILSGRLIVIREFDSPIQSLSFSPDGKFLFSGNGNTTCYQMEFKKLLDD